MSEIIAQNKLRLNLGCGNKRMPGCLNVDSVPDCNPDMVYDQQRFPLVCPVASVEDIFLSHAQKQLGESWDVYLWVIKELYRECCHGAKIHLMAPHLCHDHLLWGPTHVQPILVEDLQMFDQ